MKQLGGTGIIGQDMVCGFGNGKYKTFEGTEIVAENCVKAKVKDLVVEGKTIQDTEDLSNIESVAEVEGNVLSIVDRGKNLFNFNNLEYGDMNKDTGENLSDVTSLRRTINYISVNPKTPYIINSSCRVFQYDKDKNFLSSTAITGKFTTSENTEYIKFHGKTTDEFVDDKKIQLEEGTVSTSYEPYREPIITNINLPIPLRSLPNGVCDTIEGNKLIQRV